MIDINHQIQNNIAGALTIYKSIDSMIDQDDIIDYPTEFLNFLDFPELPVHIDAIKDAIKNRFGNYNA